MTQNTIDLWPESFGSVKVRLPVVILREQASLLGHKTGNLVQAEVKTSRNDVPGRLFRPGVTEDNAIEHRFYLVAPALGNYRYYLFSIAHGVGDVYPVCFFLPNDSDGNYIELLSEAEFLKKLAEIFNSEETKRVVQALVAQSQAA